jgi:hypothetical protein
MFGELKNREDRGGVGGGICVSTSSYFWGFCCALTCGARCSLLLAVLVLKGLRNCWSAGLQTR